MSDSSPKVVFGGFVDFPHFEDPAYLGAVFDLLEAHHVQTIDTATIYGRSEEILGGVHVGDRFVVDTKAMAGLGGPGNGTAASVVQNARDSREKLGTTVDVYYLHAPAHPSVPLMDTLKGVKEVWDSGFFKRFGISNYQPEDVEKVIEGCKELGIPPPSVYQGNYNPFARHYETTLIPILRRNNISFYAYSPMAGGFLGKTKAQVLQGAGRFDPSTLIGGMYNKLYNRPQLLEGLERWGAVANEEGVSRAELAYRWVRFNGMLSAKDGDAILVGARDQEQLKESLGWVAKGPLSAKAAQAIDEIWDSIKEVAPTSNLDQ